MQTVLRAMPGILPLFLMGLQACTTADKVAACVVPIMPTHSAIPYPVISQRLGEYGTTGVVVNIGADGVPADVTANHASGSRRLDEAAVAYIKAHYRWQPPPQGCKPAANQAAIVVAWRFEDPPMDEYATITLSEADYPPGAVERLEAGDTLLELSLAEGGVVKDGRVSKGSSYPDLDDKALAILKSRPGIMAGKPAGTQRVLARWILPADLSKGREIVESHAKRLALQAFSESSALPPVPVRKP